MPLQIFCSILISSLAVCLISTVCCIFAPLDLMQKVVPLLSNTYKEHQIRFQENLLGDLEHSPLHLIIWICARYAFRIFLYCGKEIICLTSVIHFCPTMKDLAARFMPNWVLDVSKSVVESLAIDDSELPALDIDPSAMPSSNMRASVFGLEWEDHNREDREDNYVKTMAIDSQTYDSKQHHQERIVWSYHVFDPVLGVIPRETRDLWTQGNKTFLDNESNPMLFADETTDEDNSTAAGGFKIQRSLPPVRFS